MKKIIFSLMLLILTTGCQKVKTYFGFAEIATQVPLSGSKSEIPDLSKTPINGPEKKLFSKGFDQVRPLIDTSETSAQEVFQLASPSKVLKPKKKTVSPFIDYIVEKKGKDIWLWIRPFANTASTALVMRYQTETVKTRYFLRSLLPIPAQKANSIVFEGRTLGNPQKLYFIASSKLLSHPLMGKAFRLIIPSQVGFGYAAENTYSEAEIIPGQAEFFIRRFTKKQGQGEWTDTAFHLPQLKNMLVIERKPKAAKKKKK